MLIYRAPKSQMWGHRISRLAAIELLERSEKFLAEKTVIEKASDASCSVVWTPSRAPAASPLIDAVQRLITAQPQKFDCGSEHGDPAIELRWTLKDDDLHRGAKWLDRIDGQLQSDDFSATLTKFVFFRWRDSESSTVSHCGGMFGFSLARPRGITTMFSFENREHYQSIKDYLLSIELVRLSDNRLRDAPTAKRRTK